MSSRTEQPRGDRAGVPTPGGGSEAGVEPEADEGPLATAFIGDISASRDLDGSARRHVQQSLNDLLARVNRDFAGAILADFTITVGDEFQGLLTRPAALVELAWRLRAELPTVRFWTGFGRGGLETGLEERAVGMDGPAFHRARDALEAAHDRGLHGGVFRGFGADDPVLGGLARLLAWQRRSFTSAQLEAIGYARDGVSQTDAADEIGVSRQAVSKRLGAAGWTAYRDGEESLRRLLSRYETSDRWTG